MIKLLTFFGFKTLVLDFDTKITLIVYNFGIQALLLLLLTYLFNIFIHFQLMTKLC